MELRFYAALFLRRIHWFVLVVALFSGLGIALARLLPTVYRAEARLLVESEQIPDELAASTVRIQATEQLEIIQQRILTREILVEMANRLGVYEARAAMGKGRLSSEEIVNDLRRRISITTSASTVKATAARRGEVEATIVTVAFHAALSELAARVTNELVTLILKEDVAMRTGTARQTLDFFEQEVSRLDKELAQKSAVILEFKQNNLAALPDSLDFRRAQQAAAQERLLAAERNEAEIVDRRARLTRLHEAVAGDDQAQGQSRTAEQVQLQSLRDEMVAMLAVLSLENPKVKLLAAQIVVLEKIVLDQNVMMGADGQPLSAYAVQLEDFDGQLSYLALQKAQIQAEVAELTATIAATPSNAVTLDALQRDYEGVKAEYDRAAINKAKAATGDTIEAMSKGQRITVIEQAIAPIAPASPNRPLIALGGLAAGVGFGLGLVALMELMRSGIRRPADLTQGLGITPFATLPYLRSESDDRRRVMQVWGGVAGFLAAMFAALWVVNSHYVPLDLLVERMWRWFA